jgi:hypothetical protein
MSDEDRNRQYSTTSLIRLWRRGTLAITGANILIILATALLYQSQRVLADWQSLVWFFFLFPNWPLLLLPFAVQYKVRKGEPTSTIRGRLMGTFVTMTAMNVPLYLIGPYDIALGGPEVLMMTFLVATLLAPFSPLVAWLDWSSGKYWGT